MTSPGEERLRRMLEEGKISAAQYAELLIAISDIPNAAGGGAVPIEMHRVIEAPAISPAGPPRIVRTTKLTAVAWMMIAGTAVDLVFSVSSGRFGPEKLISYGLQLTLAWGLFGVRPWAFVGTCALMTANGMILTNNSLRAQSLNLPLLFYAVFLYMLYTSWSSFIAPDPVGRLGAFFRAHPFRQSWREAPWQIRTLGCYLIISMAACLAIGFYFGPKMIEIFSEESPNPVRELRFGPFEYINLSGALASVVTYIVVLAGLVYRTRWGWWVMLVIVALSLFRTAAQLAKIGDSDLFRMERILSLAIDLGLVALLFSSRERFFRRKNPRDSARKDFNAVLAESSR